MEKLKSLVLGYRPQILLLLEIIILIIGGLVAYFTVYRYALIVRAVLGLTIIYLFYLEYVIFRMAHDDRAFFIRFELPKDIKYFVIDFFVIIILVWSGVQVLDLIRYLIHIFAGR